MASNDNNNWNKSHAYANRWINQRWPWIFKQATTPLINNFFCSLAENIQLLEPNRRARMIQSSPDNCSATVFPFDKHFRIDKFRSQLEPRSQSNLGLLLNHPSNQNGQYYIIKAPLPPPHTVISQPSDSIEHQINVNWNIIESLLTRSNL